MNIKDLKVGDKVFIREDLIDGERYQGVLYFNVMGSGVMTVRQVYRDRIYFTVFGDIPIFYSEEMVDWEKTEELNSTVKNSDAIKEYLNSKFGYLNVNESSGTFKEITQAGGDKKEITKGVTYDGTKIIVKNDGEENDIEKAVMLLMLKQRGVTYSDIKKEVEKVKIKWVPKQGEKYYWINSYFEINLYFWEGLCVDRDLLNSDNCFKTLKEAEEKLGKIKDILKGE